MILTISDNAIRMAVEFECSGNVKKYLKAYIDPVGVPTIGIGTTVYPNGVRVKIGDQITELQAYQFYRYHIAHYEKMVDVLTTNTLFQHQFDALVDFMYNAGETAYRTSTLLRRVNENANNFKGIEAAFMMFDKGDGTHDKKDNDGDGKVDEPGELQVLPGLIKRRQAENYLYRTGMLKFLF
jgi:lysozyme